MTTVYLLLALSLFFIRILAGYDSREHRGKAYPIKSRVLRVLLLDRQSFFGKTKRKKADQNKITLLGICLWSFAALVLLALPLLLLLCRTPISPWSYESARFFVYADTQGQKLAAIAVFLLFLSVTGVLILRALRTVADIGQKWLRIFVWLVMALASLSVLACGAWLLWELVLCFA